MSYATVEELVRRLGLASPATVAQQDSAQQCLDAATQEIDSHLGWLTTGPPVLTPQQSALLVIVNVDRAAEHWRLTPYGALNQGSEVPTLVTARDSFYRHARNLASLQTSWGVG